MLETQVVLKILLDNYEKGNRWLSNLDIQAGYHIVENHTNNVYYANLSRRISDISITLTDGNPFHILKDNNHAGTRYTAYKLPNLSEEDVSILKGYIVSTKPNTPLHRRREVEIVKRQEDQTVWTRAINAYNKAIDYLK